MTASVIIATRNRAIPLRDCLHSLRKQTHLPKEIIIVDSSEDDATCKVVRSEASLPLVYIHTPKPSAAIQRNIGAREAAGDIVIFLDDDVVLEPSVIAEILAVFGSDPDGAIGGVGGFVVNQHYTELSPLNRALLTLCIGRLSKLPAGKVVGPGVNFWAAEGVGELQEVEWLPTTCAAYRKDVFFKVGFPESFLGYALAEDLYLSAAVARRYKLVVATKARLYHKDLGKKTHKSWAQVGEMAVLNRHAVMVHVLERKSFIHYLQLFLYEFVYQTLASLHGSREPGRWRRLCAGLWGKSRGLVKIALGRSPHHPPCNPTGSPTALV